MFAWLPVVGDPLTVVGGIFRVKFLTFLVLVALGKSARYLAVLAFAVGRKFFGFFANQSAILSLQNAAHVAYQHELWRNEHFYAGGK